MSPDGLIRYRRRFDSPQRKPVPHARRDSEWSLPPIVLPIGILSRKMLQQHRGRTRTFHLQIRVDSGSAKRKRHIRSPKDNAGRWGIVPRGSHVLRTLPLRTGGCGRNRHHLRSVQCKDLVGDRIPLLAGRPIRLSTQQDL